MTSARKRPPASGHGVKRPRPAGSLTVAGQIASVARRQGQNPVTALADAIVESTGATTINPRAVGDQGTSFGAFQLHQGGELGTLTPAQAFNPTINATRALAQFKLVAKQYGTAIKSPGELAFLAQRPAGYLATAPLASTTSPAAQAYISKVNATYNALVTGKIRLPGVSIRGGRVVAATGPAGVGSTRGGKSSTGGGGFTLGPITSKTPVLGGLLDPVAWFLNPKGWQVHPVSAQKALTQETQLLTGAGKGVAGFAGTAAGAATGAGVTAAVGTAATGLQSFFTSMFTQDPAMAIALGAALAIAIVVARPKVKGDVLAIPGLGGGSSRATTPTSGAGPTPAASPSPAAPPSPAPAAPRPSAPPDPTTYPAYAAAVGALRTLGYRKAESEAAVRRTIRPHHSASEATEAAVRDLGAAAA